MEGKEILSIVLSIVMSFFAGAISALFFGGKTALNYMLVKASRGRKILLIAKTRFGWKTFVASKNEETLRWKYDKKKKITVCDDEDIVKYMRVECAFVDADKPLKTIKLSKGQLFPDDFDPEVFNNLLIRAMTRPTTDGFDEIKKLLQIILVVVVLLGLGMLFLFMKVKDLSGGSSGGVI